MTLFDPMVQFAPAPLPIPNELESPIVVKELTEFAPGKAL